MSRLTKTKESSTRKKIDIWLNNLKWNTDEESPDCNIFTERLKTKEQQSKLEGKEPDYSLYKSGTDEIIGIIEAKRKGKDLNETLKDAIEKYVKPLNVPVVFVSDGTFFKTWHIRDDKELTIDGEPVNEFISEKNLLRFIKEGSNIESVVSKEIKYTREQLISIFKWANDLLRKEGIREGFDRFIEFANLLFLKLISEMEIDREGNNEERILEKKYCWESFAFLPPDTMIEYINGTVLPHLVQKYNHSGDVFQNKIGITNPLTLKQIVDKLSKLKLVNIESDIKGDAFEYFLKNAVTVGNDLGEYFTPRHIVRLMTKLANPHFGDTVYDPTCGTGGFLIEAFRHIKKSCKHTKENLKILQEKTIFGRELTNTSRIAKMNMILTGDGHTNIKQMDCLQKPVKNKYDVVLANPPYGQITDYGNLYPVHSNNADCIFIQHVMLSLNENGRACIIVPEGFLFRTGVDNKTRQYLLNNYKLISVISLPSGVFKPYTGAKTDILIFESGKTENVWFYDLCNDGFELGDTRRPIEDNDIPDLIKKWEEKPDSKNSWLIDKNTIIENDYKLTVNNYKNYSDSVQKTKYDFVELGNSDYFKIVSGGTPSRRIDKYFEGDFLWYTPTDLSNTQGLYIKDSKEKISNDAIQNSSAKIIPKNAVLLTTRATIGEVKISDKKFTTNQGIKSFICNDKKISPEFLAYCLMGLKDDLIKNSNKTTFLEINKTNLMKLKIPVPPIEIQKQYIQRFKKQEELIIQLENTINALKNSNIDDSYFKIGGKKAKLKDISTKITKGTTPTTYGYNYTKYGVPFIRVNNIDYFKIDFDDLKHISKETNDFMKRSKLQENDILLSIAGTIGRVACISKEHGEMNINQAVALIRLKKDVNPKYVTYVLASQMIQEKIEKMSVGVAQKNINLQQVGELEISLPSIEIQNEIVSTIEKQINSVYHLELLKEQAENTMELIIDELFSPEGDGFYPLSKQKKLTD